VIVMFHYWINIKDRAESQNELICQAQRFCILISGVFVMYKHIDCMFEIKLPLAFMLISLHHIHG